MIQGQMEVQERHAGNRAVLVAFFFLCEFPGGVGGEAGGAADLMLVVPGDLRLEQGVGGGVVGDLLVGQQGDQTLLEGVEAALDLAFGLGVGRDAVGGAQRCEGALKLGMRVEEVGGGAVAEEGQTVGVKGGGRTVLFDRAAQVREVAPGGVARGKGTRDDFAGVIVERQDEGGIGVVFRPAVGASLSVS